MCKLGQFYLPSLFMLLINVFISRIGLCTQKYQRCSLTFALITQFICKISKEHIKGKQNSSASQTLSPALRSLVTYYHEDIDTLVYLRNFLGFQRPHLNLISESKKLICVKSILSLQYSISHMD